MQKSVIIGIASSIVLFFTGYITFSSFFMWSLPIIKNVRYANTTLTYYFIHSLIFGIALSLIPLTIALTWKLANIISVEKKIYSSLLIIACIILAGLIRHLMIRSIALKAMTQENEYPQAIPLYKVNIEIYMIIGLITGAFIAYFLFRRNKKEVPVFSFDPANENPDVEENNQ